MLSRKVLSCLVLSNRSLFRIQLPAVSSIAKAHTIKVKRQFDTTWNYYESPEVQLKRRIIYYIDEIETGPKELKIVLTEDSEDYGVQGELVSLPKHFGRMLIKSGKAVYASPENIEEYSALSKKTSQTLSGRRLMLWLKRHATFICPFRYNVPWTLTAESLARCFLREYQLVVPSSAIKLPGYTITNENVDPGDIHEINITVNNADTVPVNIAISNWEPRQQDEI